MTTDKKKTVTLREFANDRGGLLGLHFVSVAEPAGVQLWHSIDPDPDSDLYADLSEPESYLLRNWWDLRGTVERHGQNAVWQWDGHGEPVDELGNTVYRITAMGRPIKQERAEHV